MGTNKRPATEAEARALASAFRLRILRACLERALTNKEIAQRLGANPATTLHHVRTLVATGFLVAQEARRGTRGAREVPYRATGKSWELNVHESGVAGGSRAMLDAFLTEASLVNLDEAMLARLGLRLTEAEYAEFGKRIRELLEEFKQRERSPQGRPYSVFLAVHHDVSRD
ncbi:MAG TPA: winged helix-turn-helix domain-containing protein [Micromonosporaceae bacterium]|jgi:predicted ArsR family transcriptional regulator|nr:winged helix-turn-helix domain-containing protein [Micromonosporaceae bacterium]